MRLSARFDNELVINLALSVAFIAVPQNLLLIFLLLNDNRNLTRCKKLQDLVWQLNLRLRILFASLLYLHVKCQWSLILR